MAKKKRSMVETWDPIDMIGGFYVRPGLFDRMGANAYRTGVSFTVSSIGATKCTLCLFKHREDEPFARLEFPDTYRIGNVYSMFVFDLDVKNIEYAYCFDGPHDEEKEPGVYHGGHTTAESKADVTKMADE